MPKLPISLLLTTFLAAAAPGCGLVAGVEDRSLDPVPDGCSLPKDGAGRMRLANLRPSKEAIDACVRPAGGEYGRPVFRGGGRGAACVAGLSYPDVTTGFAIPKGQIDVKIIKAGGTCSSAALAEATNVDASSGAVTAVAYLKSPGVAGVTARADSAPPSDLTTAKLRIGDFMVGSAAMQYGFVEGLTLPQKLDKVLVKPVPFGGFPAAKAPSTFGTIDDNGYFVIAANEYPVGVSELDSNESIFAFKTERRATNTSVFAIGNRTDLKFPPRGLVCDDGAVSPDGLHSKCTLTNLSALTFDTWNAGLYGAFAQQETARRPYIQKALGTRTSDVMCISEVSRKSDRDALIEAAKAGGFQYSFVADTDQTTKSTDPTDAAGATPPAPTSPPCAAVDPTMVDDAYKCMINNCNDRPGDPNGKIGGGTTCLSEKCAASLVVLVGGSRAEKQCFNCMAANFVSYKSYAQNKLTCTTDPRAPMAWDGESPLMVLSKYELVNKETYVTASTYFRRVGLYAQVQVETGKAPIDYACVQLSSVISAMPYAGAYSAKEDDSGWQDEQVLQTKKLITWIKSKAATRPMVISGDWSSSPEITADGIFPENAPVAELLAGAFSLARPEASKAECTRCPRSENPYNGDNKPGWTLRTYLANYPKDSTQFATRFYTEAVVPLADGTKGPLSDTFGWSTGILRP